MNKRLFLPRHFDGSGMSPHRFVGYTGDGKVAFTEAGRALVAQPEIDHDAAMAIARELLTASCDAARIDEEARGLNQWIAKPLGGGFFSVTHRGLTGKFRPIRNGKQRRSWPGEPGVRCSVCRRHMPEGATMYVFDRSTENRKTFDEAASHFRNYRACETCMRPELGAAIVGAALLAKGDES